MWTEGRRAVASPPYSDNICLTRRHFNSRAPEIVALFVGVFFVDEALAQKKHIKDFGGRELGVDEAIFAFSPDYFRRALRQSCLELGLSRCRYVPHSLRHGGASADFLIHGSIERVQFRGRWKQMESLRTYVQSARALLAAQDVPPALNQLGMQLSDSLPYVMAHLLVSVPEVTARQRRVLFRL